MIRTDAVEHSLAYFDDQMGGYFKDLARYVAVPTESQNPARLADLERYLLTAIKPDLEPLGYECKLFSNPVAGAGPVLLARRIEDPALPTVIGYGHGDVVLGMEGRWASDRDPWRLSFEGDRVYGRGTADNKGQHLAHIAALRSVIAHRGRLGFNHKFLIEMGEENGSKGLKEIVEANKADFAADAFFASDGPRTEIGKPNITLGNRGCWNVTLTCDLREGGHHSGNWGGLLANPGIVLAHAIASITDARGKILVDGWRPDIPSHVREVLVGIDRDAGPRSPQIDDAWGEPDLSRIEKVSAWNAFEVLAYETGNPARPVNAIPPRARAVCQLRYVDGTDESGLESSLRRHLDARGFPSVKIEAPPDSNNGRFFSSRTDPRHPWAQWMKAAVERNSNHACGVLPNGGGSNMTYIFQYIVGMPCAWFPLSYAGCSQHAPDEHILKPLMREGLRQVTGIYWDLGDTLIGYRPRS
jgi:acetylornithine deacetylase/succinyl-diaminopimelate desuccinylase-like protein